MGKKAWRKKVKQLWGHMGSKSRGRDEDSLEGTVDGSLEGEEKKVWRQR